jgi:hypothetical protein
MSNSLDDNSHLILQRPSALRHVIVVRVTRIATTD